MLLTQKHYALAVMTTAGLYETSSDWLYDNPAVCEVDEGGCVVQSFLSPIRAIVGEKREAE
jgi:hypothetical protein